MNQIKTNLRVKQHRYLIKGYKRRRGLLAKNHPIVLFRERGRKFQLNIGTNILTSSG